MLSSRHRIFAASLIFALLALPSGLLADRVGNAFAGRHAGRSASNPQFAMPGMTMSLEAASAKTAPILMLHRKVIHITINNFMFTPANVVVSPGTRIIWTNHDSDPHTVDSVKNVWTSEAVDPGGTFGRLFKAAGSFAYYCSIHPFMHGSVTVSK